MSCSPESSVKESVPGQIIQAWQAGQFQLFLSVPILTELGRALNEPYFRRRLSGQDIVDLLALLVEQATMVAPVGAVPRVATHPEDDLILATAVVARADYLVTGDKHLQVLATHQSSVIVSPRAFLEILTG